MKKILSTLCLVLIYLSCNSSTQENPINIIPGHEEPTNLIWSDEFNYSGAPDPNKWSFDVEGNKWDWGNNEEQNYTSEENKNAWVEDGVLVIEARKEDFISPEDGEEKQYTSARLRTLGNGDWTYGRFDIRAKIPTGNGAWPAIWMLPTDNEYGGWPDSGEIDIMEHVYIERNTIFGTAWTEENEQRFGDGGGKIISDASENYHIYSIIWTEDYIRFLIDDIQYYQYNKTTDKSSQWPFNKKFHLLLNIAVGGDWSPEVNDSIFPTKMYVDYVRVYQ